MGFLVRQCWHCSAGETAHKIVSVTRKSANEYYAFSICSSCHLPSCAVLQTGVMSEMTDETDFENLGDIRNTVWTVVGFWPSETKDPPHVDSQIAVAEPAERAYKRALEIAKDKHTINSGEKVPWSPALSPDQDRAACETRVTLREFSERLLRQTKF
jgi:hypothetical protein